jgi:peptidoglycan/xylan/chitin deacetylase (PgdA/CDA1 family)
MTADEATIPPQHRPPRRGRAGRALGSLLAVAVLLLLVRGGGFARLLPHAAVGVPVATRGVAVLSGAAGTVAPPPAASPAPDPARLGVPSTSAALPPNELGLIPILMYHTFLPASGSDWNRTPAAFRGDLAYLYAHGYYLTSMHQFVAGTLDIPAGKSPVLLTFDDGAESQFRYSLRPDGTPALDPASAVGILEDMVARHPDFGHAGVFYVPPGLPFGDDDDKHDQRRFAGTKLAWLVAHGYELGNHTLHHANLANATDAQVRQEIAGGEDGLHRYVPGAPLETFALPYGAYPDHGDPALLRHCTYQGHTYGYSAVLLVGAEAAPSPFDRRRDLFFTPRIRATDAELGTWFGAYLDRYPAVRYVSDGDPGIVTIPTTLTPALRDKLAPAQLGGRRLVRYGP